MLGDDIVIANKDLGELYMSTIRSLGVEISELKTHKSNNFFEFAKRLFYKGQEISPFPISSLKESSKRYYRLINLFDEQSKRGFNIADIPLTVRSFYDKVFHFRSKRTKKLFDQSQICERVMRITRDPSKAEFHINEIIKFRGYQIRSLNQQECESIIANIMIEMFTESNPENLSKDKFLGLLAEELVLHFSKLDRPEFTDLGIRLINSLPQLSIYGQIEELFLNLKKEAKLIDTIHAGN
jgi:hypothetical protein